MLARDAELAGRHPLLRELARRSGDAELHVLPAQAARE